MEAFEEWFIRQLKGEERMKTKEEIKNEILELYGANEALREIQTMIHAQSMEKMKQMFALNQMLKDMGDEGKSTK
jgi:hypothetical protein